VGGMRGNRLGRNGQEAKIVPTTISALELVDAVYLMSILADQPRSIDRYIDYFGGGEIDLRRRRTGRSVTGDAVVVRA
jgi:hypothetical protein